MQAARVRATVTAVTTGADFLVRFWGVRGSIAAPGPATARYGGNTSSIEVRCGARLILLDGGTGMRYLGNRLEAVLPPKDRHWVIEQVMASEAPEAFAMLRQAMQGVFSTAPREKRRSAVSGD